MFAVERLGHNGTPALWVQFHLLSPCPAAATVMVHPRQWGGALQGLGINSCTAVQTHSEIEWTTRVGACQNFVSTGGILL
jgi:hypothetical protein